MFQSIPKNLTCEKQLVCVDIQNKLTDYFGSNIFIINLVVTIFTVLLYPSKRRRFDPF